MAQSIEPFVNNHLVTLVSSRYIFTGLKAFAFGLGRNEEALAFRCFVAVPGDMGTAADDGPVDVEDTLFWTDSFAVAFVEFGFEAGGREALAPLNGGIA